MKTIHANDQEFICDIDSPCFLLLTPEETALVRESRTQVLFRKGDHLSKQGAFSSYVLFILKGLALKYIEGGNNRNLNLRLSDPGNFIGLSAIFTKNTSTYSTVALTDCQAILIENETIIKLIEQNGHFGYGIVRRYFEENSSIYDILNAMTFKQMNGRMAETLLYLDSFRSGGESVFPLLSRKDIAEFAGITTESTVKLLKSFQADGLITLIEKDVLINKPETMKELSRLG